MTDDDISKIAQNIAERFTLDTEPERRASLQQAVSAAILQAATRDAPCADAVDAQRLNWLDKTNERFQMGWRVGIAPVGIVSIQRVIELGEDKTSIRAAIDKAIAASAPKGDGND